MLGEYVFIHILNSNLWQTNTLKTIQALLHFLN